MLMGMTDVSIQIHFVLLCSMRLAILLMVIMELRLKMSTRWLEDAAR